MYCMVSCSKILPTKNYTPETILKLQAKIKDTSYDSTQNKWVLYTKSLGETMA